MSLLTEAAEAVVETAIRLVFDLIQKEVEPDEQALAMMLAGDRLKLRAHAQERLDARKKEQET